MVGEGGWSRHVNVGNSPEKPENVNCGKSFVILKSFCCDRGQNATEHFNLPMQVIFFLSRSNMQNMWMERFSFIHFAQQPQRGSSGCEKLYSSSSIALQISLFWSIILPPVHVHLCGAVVRQLSKMTPMTQLATILIIVRKPDMGIALYGMGDGTRI